MRGFQLSEGFETEEVLPGCRIETGAYAPPLVVREPE